MDDPKVGDRVVVTVDGHDSFKGMVGTVLENSCAPWIEFDLPTMFPSTYSSQQAPYTCDIRACADLEPAPPGAQGRIELP